MNRDNERQTAVILSVIGIIPVVWLALLIAPSVKGGLPEILPSLLSAFNKPFHIEVCEDSLKNCPRFASLLRTRSWNLLLNTEKLPKA